MREPSRSIYDNFLLHSGVQGNPNMSFTHEISDLIASGREGKYWDFKEQYHDNKAALLHDIICLANSLHKGSKYLIFGVTDPYKGCQIVGIQANRKYSQSNLIDFIRSMKFAGDVRPEIELRTIELQEQEIDVLIVFDRPEKPYYLREDYKDKGKIVRASYIYTRNLDTNIAIDQSADLRIIELMWRERFGLDVQPAERMVTLL
ncbi:MAG: ATP-binding protein, partial [Acidobacteria bacterium]|nr:ATP-binding protein [Acidobacteriota bacterium]